ncbi:DUF3189 family protein [Clostridium thailandense]|uniref:DUF3189 family protein n=1 Tax=Clostridium thailandense TaxID=2794346 RepID=UPI0039896208
MIVVYHDVGGTHSTATAANIHIGKLPIDSIPTKEQLVNLPTFDKLTKSQMGTLLYIGEDEFGTKVYTIGRKYKPKLVIPAIESMYAIAHGNTNDLLVIDTHPTVNIWMKIGGFSSRALNLVSFGRPIVTYGTLKAYEDISNIVRKVKQQVSNKTVGK